MEGMDILWSGGLGGGGDGSYVRSPVDIFETELCNWTKGLTPFRSDLISCAFELCLIYSS